eukprot:TRINITY_DN2349_c0_g1_i3.p1 TRINITY_DN2349_c0_g1~~TRINITY_DN2349_c0_g1_i3.p1  ORF type:complete len:403 (-),score=85.55 TRINITY_DN2349_c0_g1_i3:949-2121(-)
MEELSRAFPGLPESLLEEVLVSCIAEAQARPEEAQAFDEAVLAQAAVLRVAELTGQQPVDSYASKKKQQQLGLGGVDSSNLSVFGIPFVSTTRCSYCGKGENSCWVTFGCSARRLTCRDYQLLVNRGWTRSGIHIYKPVNEVTCCPQRGLRMVLADFKPTKAQRSAKSRLDNWLKTGFHPKQHGSLAVSAAAPPPPAAGVNSQQKRKQFPPPNKGERVWQQPDDARGLLDKQVVLWRDCIDRAVMVAVQRGAIVLPAELPSVVLRINPPGTVKKCGHYSCAVAVALCRKAAAASPYDVATAIVDALVPPPGLTAVVDVATSGHINVTLLSPCLRLEKLGKEPFCKKTKPEAAGGSPVAVPPAVPAPAVHTLETRLLPAQFTPETFTLYKK